MTEDVQAEIDNLKYELMKLERTIATLEKGYDRRKKLRILSEYDEKEMLDEIRQLKAEQSQIKRRIISLESQKVRSKMLNY